MSPPLLFIQGGEKMFNGYDFIYDGKSSISENVKILFTEANPFEFTKSIPDKEINIFKTNRSNHWSISGITTPEPLSFQMQLMIHSDDIDLYIDGNPLIDRNRLSRISHWLFDQTSFKRLQILTDDMRDFYFMAIFKDVEFFTAGGDVCGFRFTVLCDTYGAYEEKTVVKESKDIQSFNINILQDGIYEVAPVYTITAKENYVSSSVNGQVVQITNVVPTSIITIDTDKLIAESSTGDNLYASGKFNKCFPRFKWGKNEIKTAGEFTLKINYKMIREVGC